MWSDKLVDILESRSEKQVAEIVYYNTLIFSRLWCSIS